MVHFYCRKAYRDWRQIQDSQILTVGSPIESKDVWLSGQLFWSVWESKRAVLILIFYRIFSDQKHSTRQCRKFIGVEYLVPNVNSRKMRQLKCMLWHRIKEFDTKKVQFREITLNSLELHPIASRDLLGAGSVFCIFLQTGHFGV